MKFPALLLLALLGVAHATVVHTKAERKLADEEFLKKQRDILRLLPGLGHENTYRFEHGDFNFFGHPEYFTEPTVLKEFEEAYKLGFLPRDEVFTLACKNTRHQNMLLFDMLFKAKDWDTFYKVACWARHHLNGPQFAYVLYIAVYHRPDCRGMTLPPWYELFPNLYVHAETMHKFYDAKMEDIHELKVKMNNTGWEKSYHRKMYDGILFRPYDSYYQHNEDRLSYFREDVGLSEYLSQMISLYPSWINQNYTKVPYFRRGELYYYACQQIFARYSLERIANEMPNTEMLFWNKPIMVGYDPKLTTFNGHALFPRPDGMTPEKHNPKKVHMVEEMEHRIVDTIQIEASCRKGLRDCHDTLINDGMNTIGHMVWNTPESPIWNYYGNYFTKGMNTIGYMGRTGFDHDMVPGAMGLIWTAPRDPVFYEFLHRLINMLQTYKKGQHYYTEHEMGFEGVKVDSFETEKLITYFDRFDFEVTNGVPVPKTDTKHYKGYHYIVKQQRLNHKPFNYKLTVSSNKATDAMVRIFIGPKYDSKGHEMTINQARMGFVEMDRFPVKLTNGQNMIERNSRESSAFIEDAEGLRTLMDRVSHSLESKEPFYITDSYRCGMPNRFMLPKGGRSGHPFAMYAIVTPYEKHTTDEHERHFDAFVSCGGSNHYDNKPYGFPFDRFVPSDEMFHLPNMKLMDVLVYYMKEENINRA